MDPDPRIVKLYENGSVPDPKMDPDLMNTTGTNYFLI